MKRFFSVAALAAVMLAGMVGTANARSWRVNNNAKRKAHFVDINAAMNSSEVQDGDTLYLDPGCVLASTQNVTKRVTIIGTGYFLSTETHQGASITAPINLRAAGIKLESVSIVWGNRLSICADNTIVERSYIWDVFWNGVGRNTTLRQCYLTGRIVGNGKDASSSDGCTIENCIIYYDYQASFSAISDLMNATVRNNYVRCVTQNTTNLINNFTNSIFVNNIFIQPRDRNKICGTLTNCFFNGNIMSCDEGTYTNYPYNISLGTNEEAAVFALEGTNDQRYTLKEDSPAKGAATDGGDCGPTGGLYPYVPSGFPFGMPRFESSSASTRPIDGQVKISQQVTIQNQ